MRGWGWWLLLLLVSCGTKSAPEQAQAADSGAKVCSKAEVTERERVYFPRGRSPFAPGIELALIVGLPISNPTFPAGQLSSDNPAVAEWGFEASSLIMRTHAVGTAHLVVRDSKTSELIDGNVFTVADIARIETTKSAFVVFEGGNSSFEVTAFDANACEMVVRGGGVRYSAQVLTDVKLPERSSSTHAPGEFPYVEVIPFTVGAIGKGSIVARAAIGSLSNTFPLEVVDATSVASLSLRPVSSMPWRPGSDRGYDVQVSATHVDGRVIESPKCAWTLTPDTSPVFIKETGRDTLTLSSRMAGSATVRCIIGKAETSLVVTFS